MSLVRWQRGARSSLYLLIFTLSALIEKLPDDLQREASHGDDDFATSLLELGKCIDDEDLHDCSTRSKIRLAELVRERFWLWEKAKLQRLARELESIFEFRDRYFSARRFPPAAAGPTPR